MTLILAWLTARVCSVCSIFVRTKCPHDAYGVRYKPQSEDNSVSLLGHLLGMGQRFRVRSGFGLLSVSDELVMNDPFIYVLWKSHTLWYKWRQPTAMCEHHSLYCLQQFKHFIFHWSLLHQNRSFVITIKPTEKLPVSKGEIWEK